MTNRKRIPTGLALLWLLAGILSPAPLGAAETASAESLAPEPSGAYLTVTDIGTINDRASFGAALNAAGDVAGFSFFIGTVGDLDGTSAVPFLAHAVLFADGVLHDLDALEGYATCSPLGCESRGSDVNASRWVVGENDGDYGPLAVLWLPEQLGSVGAGWNILPQLSPYHGARALALNDDGQIVGLASDDGMMPRAVRWTVRPSGVTLTDLGTLRADGGGFAQANDVNELGQVVGSALGDEGYYKPFLYLPEPAYGLAAGMHDLMPDLDDYARAVSVNDKGEVACEIDLGVPCIWLPEPAYGLPAGFSLLPLDGKITAFFPYSISESGQIAGTIYIEKSPRTGDYTPAAAVWRSGQFRVLNEMLPPQSPWDLIDARDVVRVGKSTLVTGRGRRDDVLDANGFPASHGYVLDVTCTGDLDDDGDVDADDQDILMSLFGEEVPPDSDGDLNGDGIVDERDIRLLATQINRPCL